MGDSTVASANEDTVAEASAAPLSDRSADVADEFAASDVCALTADGAHAQTYASMASAIFVTIRTRERGEYAGMSIGEVL
jgi:hypothetical protein